MSLATSQAPSDTSTQPPSSGGSGITQLTADVTAGPGSGSQAATIPNDTVTYAKMQNVSAASKLLGRGDSGSGDPQEITLGTNLSITGTTINAAGGGGGGTVTNTGTLTANNLIIGNAGVDVTALGTLGTTTTLLHGNAGGAPTFAAVDLAADVTGDLPFANLVQASAASKLVGRGAGSGAGDFQEITLGTGLSMSTTTLNASATSVTGNVGILIDGQGSVITTGVKGFVAVPVTCTITGARLLSTDAAATSGSIVIDVWKDTYANYPPTVADTITASAKPTLSSANKSNDTTLTGWTTAITAGDVLGFNVDSATTVSRVILQLTVTVP